MVCPLCNKRFVEQRHHLFSQTKWARKLYGDLLDDPRNLVMLCSVCHLNKPIPKLSEFEFCRKLNIQMRSKAKI